MRVPTRQLLAYLEGEVTRSEAAEIEARVADSAAERARLESLRGMVGALSASDPALERIDLVADVRAAAAGAATPAARRSRRALWAAVAAGLLVAILVPVFLLVRDRAPAPATDDQFRARSAGGRDAGADRWVAIKAFYVDARGEPRRIADRLPTENQGLLFAYSSTGPRPFPYLMIFAVDEEAQVYWFYPAFEDRDTDPTSVRLDRTGSDIELPFKIKHSFSGARLAIFGLFTREPLRVSRIERLFRDLGRQKWNINATERLPLSGSAQHVQRVRIER
jgi:hypothetical protein